MVVHLLEKRGHAVVSAETGKAARVAFDRQQFDIILMDMQMPEMDGLQATVLIRERDKDTGKHVPIFAMTANGMAHSQKSTLSANVMAGWNGFYATSPSDKNSYFSIIVAIPVDSPCLRTQRWICPVQSTLNGVARVISVGRVISISTAAPSGIASGKQKYMPPELTS
jgi:CheY-like chemotaxis protein